MGKEGEPPQRLFPFWRSFLVHASMWSRRKGGKRGEERHAPFSSLPPPSRGSADPIITSYKRTTYHHGRRIGTDLLCAMTRLHNVSQAPAPTSFLI